MNNSPLALKGAFRPNINNKQSIISSLKKDFQARTLNGPSAQALELTLPDLIDKVEGYIRNGSPLGFDAWHSDVCNRFLHDFIRNGGPTQAQFGKAQKMVNLAFKYLYCMMPAPDPAAFVDCHMALDKYTLEWFIRDVTPHMSPKPRAEQIRGTSWSKLQEGTVNDIYSYLGIESQIRAYLSGPYNQLYCNDNGDPLTPFEAEFYIWPEMQLIETLAAMKKADGIFNSSFPKFRNPVLHDSCCKAAQMATDIAQIITK